MNIQQLRAQIAALQDATMDENKHFRSAYDEGKFDALTAVDNLLDSLQEEPASEDLEYVAEHLSKIYAGEGSADPKREGFAFYIGFKNGAKWQKQQDQSTIELAEDHAMLAGMEKMKEQMTAKAVVTTFNVSLPCGVYDKLEAKGCKEGDRLLVIKEDLL